MKKLLKSAFIVILAIVMTFSFVACQGSRFLTSAQIDSLGERLGLSRDSSDNFINPTATIVLSFESDGETFVVELTYELLFDKAPITVNNFIALAQEGFYDDTVVSFTNADYSLFGLYQINSEDAYEKKEVDFTIKGEFGANGWFVNGEDIEDNAKHQLGCLGMYHAEQTKSVNYYDTASTGFYILWTNVYGSDKTLSNDNYAVFAYIKTCKMTVNDSATGYLNGSSSSEGLNSQFVDEITGVSTVTKKDVDNNTLSKVPTDAITITSVTISGATGSANTSYRK